MTIQKLKLLYLARIFQEETDAEHPLTAQEIMSRLDDYGITVERKTIYDDIEALTVFGMPIESIKAKHTYYYLAGRDFEPVEQRLLVDAVACSKFITEKKSNLLISKIGSLGSKYQAGMLKRQVIVANRAKTFNETIYNNVDAISDAIAQKCLISFRYFDLDLKKRRSFRRDGEEYILSPYALAWEEEKYYCVGYYERYKSISNFRVDKMDRVTILPEQRVQPPEDFNLADYSKRVFSMFSGEIRRVTFRFDNAFISAVMDKFGDGTLLRKYDDKSFEFSAEVAVSPTLFAWLFQFGVGAELVSPPDVREKMKEQLRSVLEKHNE